MSSQPEEEAKLPAAEGGAPPAASAPITVKGNANRKAVAENDGHESNRGSKEMVSLSYEERKQYAKDELDEFISSREWHSSKDYGRLVRGWREFPELACETFQDRNNSLFPLLIYADAPLSVLQEFCELNPNAGKIERPDGKRRYHPLQHAVELGSSLEVIKFLANREPEAVSIADDNGTEDLPLHKARFCRRDTEEATAKARQEYVDKVKFLAELYPQGILTQDKYGSTPLVSILNQDIDEEERQQWRLKRNQAKSGWGAIPFCLPTDKSAPVTTTSATDVLMKALPRNFTVELRASNACFDGRCRILEWLQEKLTLHGHETMDVTVSGAPSYDLVTKKLRGISIGNVGSSTLDAIFSSTACPPDTVVLRGIAINRRCGCSMPRPHEPRDPRPLSNNNWNTSPIRKLVLESSSLTAAKSGWLLEGILTFPRLSEIHLINFRVNGEFVADLLRARRLDYLYISGRCFVPSKAVLETLERADPPLVTIVRYEVDVGQNPHFEIGYGSALTWYLLKMRNSQASATALIDCICGLHEDHRVLHEAKLSVLFRLLGEAPALWASVRASH